MTLLSGDRKIMVVDDEVVILRLVSDILSRFGYTVQTARCGEEALEQLAPGSAGIDLVILDLNMPGMDGVTCLKSLLALDPTLKILISTGDAACPQLSAALDAGASDFIGKPYQIADIKKKIDALLEAPSAVPAAATVL